MGDLVATSALTNENVCRTRHAGHCWRSRDELISDVRLWTPTHGRAKAGRPARTYIQQLCEDTGCCPEDLPEAMNDWEKWRERVRDIRATSTTWWWWWLILQNSFFFIPFVQWLKWWLVDRKLLSSNSYRVITFTFRLIPLGGVWTGSLVQSWQVSLLYFSRIALELNNPRRVICH